MVTAGFSPSMTGTFAGAPEPLDSGKLDHRFPLEWYTIRSSKGSFGHSQDACFRDRVASSEGRLRSKGALPYSFCTPDNDKMYRCSLYMLSKAGV